MSRKNHRDIHKKTALKEERDKLIENNLITKLNKLRIGRGKIHFLTHIDYPQRQKARDLSEILLRTKNIENNLPTLKVLIKEIKNSFGRIFDQNKYTASYLLLGKAISNLEAGMLLSKSGFSEEMLELSRSGHESIDLGFLFIDDENKHLLKRWFKGEIIENNIARQYAEKILNKSNILSTPVDIARAKNDVYYAHSLSTHSQYTALVDSIDVFYEDLDYYKYSGFHHSAILFYYMESLYTNILLLLKILFIRKGESNINKVDKLLDEVLPKTTSSEIEQIYKLYSKQLSSH